MVQFNHGESTHDVKRWLQTRLRLQHASSTISNAVEFDAMERFLLEKLIYAEGTGNRIRIEADATGKAVIRAGERVRNLTRKGLSEIADYLSESNLQSYFELSSHTPSAARYTAGGTYFAALENTIFDPLRKIHGEDVSVSIATYGKGVPTSFFDRELMQDGNFTGLLRADNEGKMTVIRARRGDGTYFTDEEIIRAALNDRHGRLAINDIKGKLAKRLTAAVVGDSAYQISLNRSVKAGFVDPKVLFEAFDKHNGTISSGVLQNLGSLSPRNVRYMLDNPEILERGVDGAILINNKLIDDIVKGHKKRLDDLTQLMARGKQSGGFEATSTAFHADQVRRLKKNISILERHAERGGRFSNFRAMGFDMDALDADALGLGQNTREALEMLSRSMAKGDAFLMPRGKPGFNNYEMLMSQIQDILRKHDPNIRLDLENSDFLAMTSFRDKRGMVQPTLAAVAELGLRDGAGFVGLNPTETINRVRMNVENITGAPIIFRAGRGQRTYTEGLRANVANVMAEAERTGAIPIGYLREMIKNLDESVSRAEREGRGPVAESLANQRNRAVRLIERAMSGATFDDPLIVREFSNMMIASMTRAGGKIDPIMTMTSSVWGHVGTDMFAAMKRQDPSERGLEYMRTIADEHLMFDKNLGFVMNMPTAGRSYYQFGGFDLDDALEAHLRWGKNEATGRTELFSVTTRTPMSGGEGGVFKVWGFEDSPDINKVLPFIEAAAAGDTEAEQAFYVARSLGALSDNFTDDQLRGIRESQLERNVGRRVSRMRRYFANNIDAADSLEEYIESTFDVSGWEEGWRSDPMALARSIQANRPVGGTQGDSVIGGMSKVMDDFIQKFIDRQKTMWDDDDWDRLPGKTPYQHAKEMLDRRLSTQVARIKEGPLTMLYGEGQLPSEVFRNLTLDKRKQILVELADRGVLFQERKDLWALQGDGSFALRMDKVEELAELVQVDPRDHPDITRSYLDDILDNRILKMDSMSSYEAWANNFIRGDKAGWDTFTGIVNRVSESDKRELENFISRLDRRPAGEDARVWAEKMIREYDTMTRNPSLLGRSVNVTAVIDSMNSGLQEMYASGLIDETQMRRLRHLVPYMDTEALVDALTQGADDPAIFETITRTYYGQVHGAGRLMREVENIFEEISARTTGAGAGTPAAELSEHYGVSWRLFKARLGNTVLNESPGSPAKRIFFSALGEDIPEPDELAKTLRGRLIFGGGQYEKFLEEEAAQRSLVIENRERILSEEMRRILPEIRSEVFYKEEQEKASYLIDIYEKAQEAHRNEIAGMADRGHAITRIADELKTVAGRDVADELAARSLVTAFMDEFMDNGEVAEEGWKVMGALMKMTKSNQLLNSGVFSPLLLGTQAFYGRKRAVERLGAEAEGMSTRDIFIRDLEDQYNAADKNIQRQQRRIAQETFGGKGVTADEALARYREKIATEKEAALTVRIENLTNRTGTVEEVIDDIVGGGGPSAAIEELTDATRKGLPSFAEWQEHGEDSLRNISKAIHKSHYRRLTKKRVLEYMDIPAIRKIGIGALGLTAFSFLYQRNQKREEEMLGQSLPGGGSYMTPITTTQMEIASQYVPPAASGVTYNVNIRGGGSGMREELESLTGLSSGGSRYNSLPRPGGSRSAFADIQDAF